MKMKTPCFTILIGALLVCGALSAKQPDAIQFLYPKPGAMHVSSQATVILRLRTVQSDQIANALSCITVRGERSGEHNGQVQLASDNKTLIFKPDQSFTPGETVRVHLNPVDRNGNPIMAPFEFEFKIKLSQSSIPDDRSEIQQANEPIPFQGLHLNQMNQEPRRVSVNNVSVPSDFPAGNLYVTDNNNPADGHIFMNYRYGQPYNVIIDTSGTPVWYWRTWDYRRDFKVQKNGMMSMMVRGGYGKPRYDTPANWGFIGLDQNFTVTDTFRAVLDYDTDEHELQWFEDGSYFLIGRIVETVDMSQYVEGGRTNARVRETMIQGFSPEGELTFAWAAWDHFNPVDMVHENILSGSFNFPHMNAIDLDEDGHILLSSRHLSEVTKINRNTGEIMWRLGGENNEFTFVDDPLGGINYQHDIRSLGDGHYTLFDNGTYRNPPTTRAVEYILDTLAMTATLVWEHRYPYNGFSNIMGNAQRLSNGNTMINWADWGAPKAYEVTPEGEIAFQMFLDGYEVYRAFKFPWTGMSPVPYLVAESHEEAVALFINKFGDPDVVRYNIYGGTSPNPTELLVTSESTLATLTDLESPQTWYFRTTAVNGSGEESGFSNEEEVDVNYTSAGQNMVRNGNFSSHLNQWNYNALGGASANWLVEDGVCHVSITSGGDQSVYVQMVQFDMKLLEGENYLFEFDAWADAPRTIDALIVEYGDDYTNYGQIGPTFVTPVHQHFSYPFTMQDQSNFNALAAFLFGASNIDVYLDNVSFKRVISAQVENPIPQTVTDFRLLGNTPNPFNSQTMIRFETGTKTHVSIQMYDVLGRLQSTVCDREFQSGQHQVGVDGSRLSSGLYFYRINARESNGPGQWQTTSKMTLIK